MDKRLSVVMPNYNHARYLNTRIPNILEQLSAQDELIIIDDGSTDDSIEVIHRFAKGEPRIRFFQNPHNMGVAKSVNRGVELAKGRYIAMMSADDRILPGFVSKTMQVLSEHHQVAICCSECGVTYEGVSGRISGQIYTTHLLKNIKGIHIFSPEELISIFRTTSFWIPGHSSIVKRELILQYGGLDERMGCFCDWFILHAIALNHEVAYLPETLSLLHQHGRNYSVDLDRRRRGRMEMALFSALVEKKNRSLRTLFRRSGLLAPRVKNHFIRFLFTPCYWDFLYDSICKYLKKKIKLIGANEKELDCSLSKN